jgi:hypothetical protein
MKNFVDETLGCVLTPEAKLYSLPADYNLCMYLLCTKGTGATASDVSCSAGQKSQESISGKTAYGCCSSNGGTSDEYVKVSYGCPGTGDDDVDVWIKVYPVGSARSATPYKVDHQY